MTFDWARTPVARLRDAPAGVDQYGDPIPGVQVREELPPGLFAPDPSDVNIGAGVASASTQPSIYWPGEWPDVQLGDLLEADGDVWRVDGRPAAWPLGLVVKLAGNEPSGGTNG